ncbi:hypothetical protein ACIQH9_06690 [Pseudarthrobacter oxydans]|uniref:hypothetical protein n=1 Tax=Pseudarthrobacter oxydans TaxID=1671 RepID=UPI0038050910
MTAAPRRIATFLLRAGLLTAALAIIAGIFGMHVMTGAHNMTGAHTMTPAAVEATLIQVQSAQTTHGSHQQSLSFGAAAVSSVPVSGLSSSCASPGTCPEMSAMNAACVLSAASTSFSAPLPGTAPYASPDVNCQAATSIGYSYWPGSPSPGDLCISRT